MKKLHLFIILVLITAMLFTPQVGALSYQYNEWDEAVEAPEGFACTRNAKLDLLIKEDNMELSDLFADEDGNLVVLDSIGGKMYVLDSDLNYKNTIRLTENGQELYISSAGGVFASGKGENKKFYITDPANGEIVLTDYTGALIRKIGRPDTDLIDETVIYDPTKVQLDKNGNLYVLAPSIYMGACVLSEKEDYKFKTFIAANNVEQSLSVVMDYFWKQILSDDAVDRMSSYVPVAFTNFTLDSEGYIYTVTNKNTDASTKNEIKKFNTASNNILPDTKYGDLETKYVDYKLINTSFTDVAVSKSGNIVAVDGNLCRVHIFNQKGDRLFTFGQRGHTIGNFDTPVAIEVIGNKIYVLDGNNASISLFEPTKYGLSLLEADRLTGEGEYLEASKYWKDVLNSNSGSILALNGMGRAAIESKDYDTALEYFKKSGSREEYSEAFGLYRDLRMKDFFPLIFAVVFIGFAALLVVERRFKYKRNSMIDPAKKSFFGKIRYTLFHPCEGGMVLARRTELKSTMIFSIGVVAIWFVASVLEWQYTGFIFNENDLESFEVLIHILKTIGLFALWVLSIWFVSNLMNSSARMGDIVIVTAVALLPYIASILLKTVLSNFMILDEVLFINALQIVLILWAGAILIGGMKEIHEMSAKKTVLLIIFTILGMAFILFLIFLLFSLFENVFTFISQVWQEFIKQV